MVLISKYEVVQRLCFGQHRLKEKFGTSKSIVKEHQSFLRPVDSYSEIIIPYEQKTGFVQFLIDKLSLKFNLACSYGRMPSRIDFAEKTGVGVIQGAYLYQKAAGVLGEMIEELKAVRNLHKCSQSED